MPAVNICSQKTGLNNEEKLILIEIVTGKCFCQRTFYFNLLNSALSGLAVVRIKSNQLQIGRLVICPFFEVPFGKTLNVATDWSISVWMCMIGNPEILYKPVKVFTPLYNFPIVFQIGEVEWKKMNQKWCSPSCPKMPLQSPQSNYIWKHLRVSLWHILPLVFLPILQSKTALAFFKSDEFHWYSAIFKSYNRFSIGLRSFDFWLWLGHSKTARHFLLNHSSVALACWKVNVWISNLRKRKTGFPQEFPYISCHPSFLGKYPQSMKLPPLCFTVGIMFWGRWEVLVFQQI